MKCFRNHVCGLRLLISLKGSDFTSSFAACPEMIWQKAVGKEIVLATEATLLLFLGSWLKLLMQSMDVEDPQVAIFSPY